MRLHVSADEHGGRVSDRPAALHEAERLAAMRGGPRLRHERGAARPDTAHPEAEEDAEDHELLEGPGEAARRREHRVERDAQHQRARAPEPIGDPSEADAAGGGRDEHHRAQESPLRLRQLEIRADGWQHEREEHHVERVEHPPEHARDERAARVDVRVAPPAHSHPPIGATVAPAAWSAARIRFVSSCAPGVSPWTQIVSTRSGTSRPAAVSTTRSPAMRTARATTASGSWMTAPGRLRGVSEP